jgi:hypothetical protein
VSVRKPGTKRSLGRLRRRWEDNTKINLRGKKKGWRFGLDSCGSGYGPVAGSDENFWFRKTLGIS